MFGIKKLERRANLFCRIRYFTRLGNQELVGMRFSQALGNQCRTESRIQQRILKSGKEMIIRYRALGNQCGVSGVYERSLDTETPVRGMANRRARTNLDYHNMQISGNHYLEKVFKNL